MSEALSDLDPVVVDEILPKPDAFVHLSVHSEFSLVDGLIKVNDLAKRAAQGSMPAVALTDRGNLFGLVKFQSACHAAGVKPIIGAELAYEHGGLNHCVVLVTSAVGYRNLLTLVSGAYTNSGADAAHHGVISRAELFARSEGLIVLLSARSDLGRAIASDDGNRVEVNARAWQTAFDDRLYLEVCRTGRGREEEYVLQAFDWAIDLDIPLVATNDVCFLADDDFEAHETRVCIQDGRVLNDPRRERRYSDLQYLRSADEMIELFADLPEAITNAVEIAKRCSYEVELGTYYLPNFPVPDGVTLEQHLESTARTGLDRYLEDLADWRDRTREDYDARLGYELGVINSMGFAGYFLIVQEFVNWAKDQSVPVGPGRGSGAASLVAFCLGITDLDPLEYDLLFERLLNPERVSMPDFDIDFCNERRDKVIAHVVERYGQDAVSQIVTFGTMAAKAVVRDVARVQGKPYGLADRLSKLIPFGPGVTLEQAVAEEEELREFIDRNDEVGEIMDMAFKLEGIVRNTGKHAGGVVIAPTTLTEYVPLYADESGGSVVSQYDLYDVEQAGLVKFDFLSLKTLTIIDWSVHAINAERAATGHEPLDLEEVPLDDAPTYELLKTAETTAVFQLESEGMKDLIRRLLPDSMDDIIALVALFRPGPLQSGAVDEYVDRKHGRSPVEFAHPSLREVLNTSYGVMLYQEHVMRVAQVLAGFSLGQADLLRKAMGKKKPEEMAKMREMFLDGTNAAAVDPGVANSIFDQMEKFAGYAFNKAHSAGYAILTYQTAYLKTHYPAHFMAAVISADMQNIDKVVTLVDEVQRMGFIVHPPNVNTSGYRFRAVDGNVLYGLGAVRGVGEGPVEAIQAEVERGGAFVGLDDFCQRVDGKKANKRVVDSLIRSGAMDEFGADEPIDVVRARLIAELPAAMRGAEQASRNESLGMDDMFGGLSEPTRIARQVEFEPLTKRERLEGEKDTLGLFLTGHPIEEYLDDIRQICPKPIGALKPGRGSQIVAGLVVATRTRRSRRGDTLGFVLLDDRSGRIEASVFAEVYDQHRDKLGKDAIVVIEGEVQVDEFTDRAKLRASNVLSMQEARRRYARRIAVDLDHIDANVTTMLKETLMPFVEEDGCAVSVCYGNTTAEGQFLLGDRWRVVPSDELLANLGQHFGAEAVSVVFR